MHIGNDKKKQYLIVFAWLNETIDGLDPPPPPPTPAQLVRVMKTYPSAGYVIIVPSAWARGGGHQPHLPSHSTMQNTIR